MAEAELTERMDGLLAGTDGLAFVTPYPPNLQPIAALSYVATANGRTHAEAWSRIRGSVLRDADDDDGDVVTEAA